MPFEQTIKKIEENKDFAAYEQDIKIKEAIAAHLQKYPGHGNVALGLESLHDRVKDSYEEETFRKKTILDGFLLLWCGYGVLSWNVFKEIDAIVGIDDLREKKDFSTKILQGVTVTSAVIGASAGLPLNSAGMIASSIILAISLKLYLYLGEKSNNLTNETDFFERAKKADHYLQEIVKPYILDGSPYRGLA